MFLLKKWLMQRMMKRSKNVPALSLADMETKHKNPDQPLFNDSSYFNGLGDDGSFFVVRQSFRTTRGNEHWLKFHFPDLGTFALQDFEKPEGEGFQQGPLEFRSITPGKVWKVLYEGPIQQGETQHDIRVDLTFIACQEIIDFKDGTNQDAIAATIAREKWSRTFFNKLRDMKKTHLEQAGHITGTVTIDGQVKEVQWRSVRDHSWGIRKWGHWKRHMWLGAVLDNGDALNLSSITYDFLGQLAAGYITHEGKTYHLQQVPRFEDFAADPLVPKQQTLHMQYGDNLSVEIEWSIYNNFLFTMDNEYEIFEGMANYTINGIPGKGVAEFGLNPKFHDVPFL